MMLTKTQIQNAYLHSGLDSYPDAHWMKQNEHGRWGEIEELIKYLYLKNTELANLVLPPVLNDLNQVWQQQTEAFNRLCQALNLYPSINMKDSDKHNSFGHYEESPKEKARQAAEILLCYIKNFGEFDNNRLQYWSAANYIMNRYSYDLNELNEWLNWYGQTPKPQPNPSHQAVAITNMNGVLLA